MYQQTQQDLKDFHTQMGNFWKRLPDDVWDKKTGTRDKDWTMHELLAHLLSIAQIFNKTATATLRNEDLEITGFDNRDQFADWNDSEIERLTKVPPNGLIVQFLQELRMGHDLISKINEDNVNNLGKVMQFSRPAPAIEYIQSHLSHVGVIHGAQAVVALGREPLWVDFSPDFTERVTKHYLNQWSLSYWIDEGGQASQAINFHIDGEGGGEWHIQTSPTGATVGDGIVEGGEFDIFFASPDVFFGVFTNYLSMREAMVGGQLRVASDVRDTMNMFKLFAPKRPKPDA